RHTRFSRDWSSDVCSSDLHLPPLNEEEIAETYLSHAERLRPFVTDTSIVINEALKGGKYVVFEGAQGTMLDLDHGTYPFVTSSRSEERRVGKECSGG